MEIDRFVRGHKVRGFEWIDGKHYYLNIESFLPGGNANKPVRDESFLFNLKDENKIVEYLDSIVFNYEIGKLEPFRMKR